MAYFKQNGEQYNEEIRKIEITDPVHADLINDLIQLLVNNDAFAKKYIDEHLNVDNTADINKPVSTAQAAAITDAKKAGTDAQTNINNHTSNINNPHNVTKTQVGLSNVDNTADINKPVSVAQQDAIDAAYANSNYYTDKKIAELINGAPTTLDTLKEIADAMAEQESVVEALDEAIGKKANESEFNSHVTNKSNPHGVTASQIGALATNGDSKLNTVTFTSGDVDDASATRWTSVSKLASGITHKTFFERVAQMFKNVRYLYKMLGTTDISEIGDGTVTGGLSKLNSKLNHEYYYCTCTYGGTETQAVNCNVNREYICGFTLYIDVIGKIAHCTGSIAFNKAGVNIDNIITNLPINAVRYVNIPIVTYQGGSTGMLRLGDDGHITLVASQLSLNIEYDFNFTVYIQ